LCFPLSKNSLLFLLFLIPLSVFGQEPIKIPLLDYIKQVEDELDFRFSYADETIEGIVILPPPDNNNIHKLLHELSIQTGLKFSLVGERFITISPLVASPGKICGVIYDIREKIPVDIATVIYGDRYTLSDSSGFFEIEKIENLKNLTIQRNGYVTQDFVLIDGATDCQQIFLTPDIIQLEEVTVFKLLTRGINRDAGGDIELDVANLGLLPGLTEPDVLQSIQALPGIQSINETISDINIRGGTNDQNLVLWDGIKMYQTGHFFGLISAFNPYLNNRVKIIKNGSSAGYGDGVSGTVDIESDDKLVDGIHGGAGINMIQADAFLKIPISKKATLQVAGRRSITDMLKTPMFNNYFERVFRNTDVTRYSTAGTDTTFNSDENFYFYDISANLIIDITKNDRLKFNFIHFFNDLKYQEDLNLSGSDDSKTSSLRQQSLAGSLQYDRIWNQKLVSNLRLSLSSYRLNAVNFDIPNNQRVIQENEVLDLGIKFDTRWMLNNQWDFLFGYQASETGIGNLEEVNNPEFFRYIKQVILTHSGFAEANYSPGPNTRLRIGTRGNYLPKFGRFLIEPRIALSQQLGQGFSVELLGEFKHQTATQVIDLQNDFLGVESRRWILSNKSDVPIVQSRQISSALIYQRPALLISLEGYYKYVSGITSSSQAFQNQYQFVRTAGNYDIYGTEVLVNWKNEQISAWSSYTLSYNQYNFPELEPSEFPNNLDIRHTINAGLTWYHNDFEASTGINWHSGKPFTEALGIDNGEISYATPNNERLPGYFRLDLSVRYNFMLGSQVKGQVGGSIWNLTNHRNVFNIYHQVNGDNTLSQIDQVALGITPNLSLRINF
jgi:outer membrane cobalamin receptor